MQSQKNFLCLSPQCKAPFERICHFQNLQQHQNCKKWIIRLDEYFQLNDFSPKNCCLDFYERPMESIKAIKCLQSSFRLNEFIKKSYQLIKNRIDQYLFKIFQQMYDRINISMSDSLELYQYIVDILNCQHSLIEKNGFLNNSILLGKLQDLQSHGRLNFFNQSQLELRLNKILSSVSQLSEGFVFKQSLQSLKNRIDQQIEVRTFNNNIYSYNEEGLNQKIQTLASMFNCKPPQIQVSSNQSQGKCRCFICEQQIVGKQGKNNKQKKKDVFSSILKHMKNSHEETITFRFQSKLSKATSYKLSIASFLKEIYQTKCTKFIVIDRENAGNFELSYEQANSTYAIEIVSKPNEKIARGRYIVADSNGKDSADLFSVIVIYQLFKVPNSEVQLITKDHYGKTLSSLFKSMGKNLICEWGSRIQ